MDRTELEKLPREALLKLLEITLKNMQSLDGLWFRAAEAKYGTEEATRLDEIVWEALGATEARRIKRAFDLNSGGLELVAEALGLNPTWVAFADSQVVRVSEKEAIFRVSRCVPQETRVRKGLGVFSCEGIETGYLRSFARELSPGIHVRCGFCPPAERRDGFWCQWHLGQEDD